MAKKSDIVASGIWGGTSDAINGVSLTTGITAYATGGQASATVLSSVMNVVGTVGTAADSVKVPANPSVGDEIFILNKTAASMNLFPQTNGYLNNAAQNGAVAIAAGKSAVCKAINATDWIVVVSA